MFHRDVLLPEQQVVLAGAAALSRKWNAYLAGGAAAALQLGHRRSVDFDWFTRRTLAPEEILADVRGLKLPVDVRQNSEGTFLANVGNVEFSVFRYPYELVALPVTFDGCHLASLGDIAAMKMTAIVQRAVKRDYVDLHVLFERGKATLSSVVSTMRDKFPGLDPHVAIRAMTYFNDVEDQPMPQMLIALSWQDVKRGLEKARARLLERGGRGL